MKKIIYLLTVLIMGCVCADAVTIDMAQKVSRRENRTKIYYNDSYEKDVSRTKTFTVTVKNTIPMEVIVVFFASVGGKIKFDVSEGEVTMHKPFLYEYTGSASSNTVKIDFFTIEDYYKKSGNDRVEACVFVFNKKGGKYLGYKYTSKAFADSIMKVAKNDISELVKQRAN